MRSAQQIVISGISVDFRADEQDILKAAADKMKRAGCNPAGLHFQIYKRSIDARRHNDIRVVCSVLVSGEEGRLPGRDKLQKLGGKVYEDVQLEVKYGQEQLTGRPIIVGSGPAGMFCGLLLAQNGYAPIVIERGGNVSQRSADVENFYRTQILNTESNIQFGAGGAGTFSDGKLVTRISDARCGYVLRKLHEFGAPETILTQAKPHVGTDILKKVTDNLLAEIKNCGGEVIYNCRLDDFNELTGGIKAKTSRGDIAGGVMVLALGHSARDTSKMLMSKDMEILPKAFSVGVRIEHLQSDIDQALYGKYAGDVRLGPAEYTLSDTTGDRGVYTFCMCPGGEVVAAASEQNGVVVNGMSYHARDGKNANSAVAVSIRPDDFGNTVDGAIEFQRKIEKAAFVAGGGKFRAPIQTVGDFLQGISRHEPVRVQPTYMKGNVSLADLGTVLPDFVCNSLRRGLISFGRKIRGFDAPDAVLTGAETRTSSPLCMPRSPALTAVGYDKIYPCGEGAGYAGGITSAAVDGIRVAQAIMERYAPLIKN